MRYDAAFFRSRMFQSTFGDGSSSVAGVLNGGRAVGASGSSVEHQGYDWDFYCNIQPSW